MLFAASLRSYLRRTPAGENPSALVLAGAVLMAAGALLSSGVEFGLANKIHHLGPEAVQTLNFVTEEVAFLPLIGGAFLFAIGSGLAILRGAPLPKWLGWVAIVLGIAALVPPAAFPSLVGFAIWSTIVSILIYLRTWAGQGGALNRCPSALGHRAADRSPRQTVRGSPQGPARDFRRRDVDAATLGALSDHKVVITWWR